MKALRTYMLLFVLLGGAGTTFAGSDRLNVDSLRKLIKVAKNDSVKFDLINELWLSINSGETGESCVIADSALALAQRIGYKRGIARANTMIGFCKQVIGEYPASEKYLLRSLQIYREIGDSARVSGAYSNLANTYFYTDNRTMAMAYNIKALKLAEGKDPVTTAICYENLGILYAMQKQYKEARSYFRKSLGMNVQKHDSVQIAKSYNNLGVLASEEKNYDSSLYYNRKSMEIREKINDVPGISSCYFNQSNLYILLGKYDLALESANRSLEIQERLGKKLEMSSTEYIIGNILMKRGNAQKAIPRYRRAIELGELIGSPESAMNGYQGLAEAYASIGDFKLAHQNYKRNRAIHDSLYSEESRSQMSEMASKYENEKQEKELEILQQEEQLNNLDEQRKTSLMNYSLGGLALILILLGLTYRRYYLGKKTNKQLEDSYRQVSYQSAIIQHKNQDITDSIIYARRIQQAMLPSDDELKKHFSDASVFYKPKDIVSGDLYWMLGKGDEVFAASIDCTGHGVPGALLSIVGYNSLNEIVNEMNISDTSNILNLLHKKVTDMLNEEAGGTIARETMDIALARLNKRTGELQFSGASASMYVHSGNKITNLRGDIYSIGGVKDINETSFKTTALTLQKGDLLYFCTDGYASQFGGQHGKKFMAGPLKELLVKISAQPLSSQANTLEETFNAWKGSHAQVDDICIMGLRF